MENVTFKIPLDLKENNYASSYNDRYHAVDLVNRYGEDSLSYLTLEKDKKHFISSLYNGFIAYVEINKVAICVGNPICEKVNRASLLQEFKKYCSNKKLKICFSSISEDYAEELRHEGFEISKYGVEAILDLNTYEIKGSQTSKLRQKLKRAEKSGITVIEYFPAANKNNQLEAKIHEVSEKWFQNKKGRLTFTLGELNLEEPLGRRYFIALDKEENLQSILVFSPFLDGKGYFLDVMRRLDDSIPGVMEKSIIDAAMKMKSEGIYTVSLGLAPLAEIEIERGKSSLLEIGMNFVYNHVNDGYCFKSLYDYKRKFSPSHWSCRYVAHEKSLSSIKTAYVMTKARNVDDIYKKLLLGICKYLKR